MTKQEEVFLILQEVRLGNLSEYEATLKLQELGVVIKVDRELPDFQIPVDLGNYGPGLRMITESEKSTVDMLLKAGYILAVEPLIKEEK